MEMEKIIAKGHHAQALLEDELLKEVLSEIEDHYTKTWRATKKEDAETRELAYLMVKAVDEFRGVLMGKIADGVHSQHRLEQMRSEKDKYTQTQFGEIADE